MNHDDRREFASVLLGIAELKRTQLSPMAIDLFWTSLDGWTIAEFKAAAMTLLNTCEFMPQPFDFQRLREQSNGQTFSEAWTRVLTHIRGGYRNGPLGDTAIDSAVAAMGGYRALATCDVATLPARARDFRATYGERQAVGRATEALPANVERIGSGGLKRVGHHDQ